MAAILRTLARFTSVTSADQWISQMYWLPGTGGGTTADATDCLDRFRDVWVALGPKICTGVTINFDPFCLAINDATGDITGAFAATPVAAVTSSAAGDALPAQTQGLIRWNTSQVVGGRFVKGRTFVPLPPEGDNTSGVPSGSYISQLGFGIAAALAAGATASAPVIWHRPSVASPLGQSALITSGQAVPSWSVLRSRR